MEFLKIFLGFIFINTTFKIYEFDITPDFIGISILTSVELSILLIH